MVRHGVRFGERVALFDAPGTMALREPAMAPQLLLPGDGPDTRARAATASHLGVVRGPAGPTRRSDQSSPRGRKGAAGRSRAAETTRSRSRVVLPGQPTAEEAARRRFGIVGPAPVDEAVFWARCTNSGDAAWFSEMLDVSAWTSALARTPAGPALATVLAERPAVLTARPGSRPWSNSAVGWSNAHLDGLQARARLIASLQADQYRDVAAMAADYPGLREVLGTELGLALAVGDAAGDTLVRTAVALTSRLPHTFEALAVGDLGDSQARAVSDGTKHVNDRVARAVDERVAPKAVSRRWRAELVRRAVAREIIALDAEGAAERHRAAARERTMSRRMLPDGMAAASITSTAQDIALIWDALTGVADAARVPGDPRTLGNRRVDALADLAAGVLAGTVVTTQPSAQTHRPSEPAAAGALTCATAAATDSAAPTVNPTDCTGARSADANSPGVNSAGAGSTGADSAGKADAGAAALNVSDRSCTCGAGAGAPVGTPIAVGRQHGQRPHIQVTMPLSVLIGHGPGADDPCELAGYGAITAAQARTIAADGVLTRLVTDPLSGTLLDYGRTRYKPPDSLADFVIARDQTCPMPGCLHAARRGQLDHVVPFRPGHADGGATSADNLAAPDHHHHRAKDGGGCTLRRAPDGSYTWTTPLGRTYTRDATVLWRPSDPHTAFDLAVVDSEARPTSEGGIGNATETKEPAGTFDEITASVGTGVNADPAAGHPDPIDSHALVPGDYRDDPDLEHLISFAEAYLDALDDAEGRQRRKRCADGTELVPYRVFDPDDHFHRGDGMPQPVAPPPPPPDPDEPAPF